MSRLSAPVVASPWKKCLRRKYRSVVVFDSSRSVAGTRWSALVLAVLVAVPVYVQSGVLADPGPSVTPGLPITCVEPLVDAVAIEAQDTESSTPESSTPESSTPVPSDDVVPDSSYECPGVVMGVTATAGINEVTLTWSAPMNAAIAGVTSYVVDVRTDARLETVAAPVTSITVGGLANGVEARFAVYAVGPNGAGSASDEVTATPTTGVEGEVAGLIVKFADPVVVGDAVQVDGPLGVSADLVVADQVADDVVLVELDVAVSLAEAEAIAEDLEATDRVEWAEPDQFLFTATSDTAQPVSVPSDAEWSRSQWNLWDTYGIGVGDGASSMTEAWTAGTGEGSTVAVIDTGVTAHPDLDSQLVSGYDFVSNPDVLAADRDGSGGPVPFDGDYVDTNVFGVLGRDADPTDPGDWRGVAPIRDSSWHGTHIAGVIAARANNQQGIVGVAPGAKIQPIRALSWRGGLLSDIAAAVAWASGASIDGVPANTTPSNVINLSFAVQAACPTALQEAIDTAIANGSVVIAAAGNANSSVSGFAPANCDGVIAVGAT
ncbi:MAG: Extracellular basic protease precursor, partial [Actinomycetota bacterium]